MMRAEVGHKWVDSKKKKRREEGGEEAYLR